ncbi:tagC [Scenedesmus sp. PABB004]|nr:tagC [Scenedesmus sp. PABB004]
MGAPAWGLLAALLIAGAAGARAATELRTATVHAEEWGPWLAGSAAHRSLLGVTDCADERWGPLCGRVQLLLQLGEGSSRTQLDDLRRLLHADGALVSGYLPRDTWLVVGAPDRLRAHAYAQHALLPYSPEFKIAPEWQPVLELVHREQQARAFSSAGDAAAHHAQLHRRVVDHTLVQQLQLLPAAARLLAASPHEAELAAASKLLIGVTFPDLPREELDALGLDARVLHPAAAAAADWAAPLATLAGDDGRSERHLELCRPELIARSAWELDVAVCPQDLSDALYWLSNQAAVHWLAPRPRLFLQNMVASMIVQDNGAAAGQDYKAANSHLFWEAGLDGRGQIIGIGDSGIDMQSCFFADAAVPFVPPAQGSEWRSSTHRKVVLYWGLADSTFQDLVGHGTHTSGSLAGIDPADPTSKATGAARSARIAFADLSTTDKGDVNAPQDLEADYFPKLAGAGASIFSDSWGSSSPVYDFQSSRADAWLFKNQDTLSHFAAGNYGENDNLDTTITSPATAKNVVTVGATKSLTPNYISQTIAPVFLMSLEVKRASKPSQFMNIRLVKADFGGDGSALKGKPVRVVRAMPPTACGSLTGDAATYKDAIVLAKRGSCFFSEKMAAGSAAGAAAVVIINDRPGGYFKMDAQEGEGAEASKITLLALPQRMGLELWALFDNADAITADVSRHSETWQAYEDIAAFSSFGPAADGRIKPDVVAPGELVSASSTDADPGGGAAPSCAIGRKSGTSMATPMVAGHAAIVRQYFMDGFYPSGAAKPADAHVPSGPLLKAVMMGGACDMKGNTEQYLPLEDSPSMRQGFGRLCLCSSLRLTGLCNTNIQVVDRAVISAKESHRYCLRTTGGDVRVMLVWYDAPAVVSADTTLVNDLDLTVVSAGMGGQSFHGNMGQERDAVNTAERVWLKNVPPGGLDITVTAASLGFTGASTQNYSLVVQGAFTDVLGSPANPDKAGQARAPGGCPAASMQSVSDALPAGGALAAGASPVAANASVVKLEAATKPPADSPAIADLSAADAAAAPPADSPPPAAEAAPAAASPPPAAASPPPAAASPAPAAGSAGNEALVATLIAAMTAASPAPGGAPAGRRLTWVPAPPPALTVRVPAFVCQWLTASGMGAAAGGGGGADGGGGSMTIPLGALLCVGAAAAAAVALAASASLRQYRLGRSSSLTSAITRDLACSQRKAAAERKASLRGALSQDSTLSARLLDGGGSSGGASRCASFVAKPLTGSSSSSGSEPGSPAAPAAAPHAALVLPPASSCPMPSTRFGSFSGAAGAAAALAAAQRHLPGRASPIGSFSQLSAGDAGQFGVAAEPHGDDRLEQLRRGTRSFNCPLSPIASGSSAGGSFASPWAQQQLRAGLLAELPELPGMGWQERQARRQPPAERAAAPSAGTPSKQQPQAEQQPEGRPAGEPSGDADQPRDHGAGGGAYGAPPGDACVAAPPADAGWRQLLLLVLLVAPVWLSGVLFGLLVRARTARHAALDAGSDADGSGASSSLDGAATPRAWQLSDGALAASSPWGSDDGLAGGGGEARAGSSGRAWRPELGWRWAAPAAAAGGQAGRAARPAAPASAAPPTGPDGWAAAALLPSWLQHDRRTAPASDGPPPAAAPPAHAAAGPLRRAGSGAGHAWYVGPDDLARFTADLAAVDGRLLSGDLSAEGWTLIMDKEVPGVVRYASFWRPAPGGTTDYLSLTLLPGTTAQEVHEFNLDDAARTRWDPMLRATWLLAARDAASADEQLVAWLRSFPYGFLRERLYSGIARRTFRGRPGELFGVTKVVHTPATAAWAADNHPDVVQVLNYSSAWRCRTVTSPWGGGAAPGALPACELVLLHHDELRIKESLARLAIRMGMWRFVQGMVEATGPWLAARRERGVDPFAEDPGAACRQPAPPAVAAPHGGAAAPSAAAAAAAAGLRALPVVPTAPDLLSLAGSGGLADDAPASWRGRRSADEPGAAAVPGPPAAGPSHRRGHSLDWDPLPGSDAVAPAREGARASTAAPPAGASAGQGRGWGLPLPPALRRLVSGVGAGLARARDAAAGLARGSGARGAAPVLGRAGAPGSPAPAPGPASPGPSGSPPLLGSDTAPQRDQRWLPPAAGPAAPRPRKAAAPRRRGPPRRRAGCSGAAARSWLRARCWARCCWACAGRGRSGCGAAGGTTCAPRKAARRVPPRRRGAAMSKGKRKSSPAALLVIRQKLRDGTLCAEDRATIALIARLDLIALIQGELGVELTGSQRNSVAAMTTWLLGPEEGATRQPRVRRRGQLCKRRGAAIAAHGRPRPGSDAAQPASTSPWGTQPSSQSLWAALNAVTATESGGTAPGGGGGGAGGGVGLTAAAVRAHGDRPAAGGAGAPTAGAAADPQCESSCEDGGGAAGAAGSGGSGAEMAPAPARDEPAPWLRELHRQLAAAATTVMMDDADDGGDDAGTAQSALTAGPAGAAAGGGAPGPDTGDDALESQLLHQLLHDMQLSPAPQPEPELKPAPAMAPPALVQVKAEPLQQAAQPALLPPQLVSLAPQQVPWRQQGTALALPQLVQTHGGGGLGLVASCPLPAGDSWTGHIPEPSANALSSEALVWPECGGSITLKKRDRHALFNAVPEPVEAPLAVEVSGPSADVFIKRRSMQLPGSAEVAAVGSFTAGAAAAMASFTSSAAAAAGSFSSYAHSAPSYSVPSYSVPSHSARLASFRLQGSVGNLSEDSFRSLRAAHAAQQAAAQQAAAAAAAAAAEEAERRSGLRRGMKGLAKKFKALLHRTPPVAAPPAGRQLSQPAAPAAAAPARGPARRTRSAYASVADYAPAELAELDAAEGLPGVLAGPQPSNASSLNASTSITARRASLGVASTSGYGTSWTAGPSSHALHSSFGSSRAGASGSGAGLAGGNEHFGEKLKLLRAMYNSQYAAAGPDAAGLQGGGAPGSAPGMEPLPILAEEGEAPAAGGGSGSPPRRGGSPGSFMAKLSKVFDLGGGRSAAEEAAAAVLAGAGGVSLTERSNSSFSMFLARVASTWRQDSGLPAQPAPAEPAAPGGMTFHEDSYPAEVLNSAASFRAVVPSAGSFRPAAQQRVAASAGDGAPAAPDVSMRDGVVPAQDVSMRGVAAELERARAAPDAGMRTPDATPGSSEPELEPHAIEVSCTSFSRLFGSGRSFSQQHVAPQLQRSSMDADGAAVVEPSGCSLTRLFSSSGRSFSQQHQQQQQHAGPQPLQRSSMDADGAAVVEPSGCSLTRLFSSSGRSFSQQHQQQQQHAGPQPLQRSSMDADGAAVVEPSGCSLTRLFSSSGRSFSQQHQQHQAGPQSLQRSSMDADGAAAVERSGCSLTRLFSSSGRSFSQQHAAAPDSAQAMAVEASGCSLTRIFSGGRSFTTNSVTPPSTGGDSNPDAGAAAAHAHAVEGSGRSFSRLLGPCGGADILGAAGHFVEGSGRSFSRMFSTCSCAPEPSVAAGVAGQPAAPPAEPQPAAAAAGVPQPGWLSDAAAAAGLDVQAQLTHLHLTPPTLDAVPDEEPELPGPAQPAPPAAAHAGCALP